MKKSNKFVQENGQIYFASYLDWKIAFTSFLLKKAQFSFIENIA